MHLRRLAAHYLLTPCGLYSRPLMTFDEAGRMVALAHYGDDLDFQAGVEFRSGVFVPPSLDEFDMSLCADEPLLRNALFREELQKAHAKH